jgi:DNA-3-methyladenine glycosylase I
MAEKNLVRCPWVPKNDALYTEYHDKEWGVPVYDDQKIFEFLTLEIFQAGLSWRTVLYKRENFRKAFLNFDVKKVSEFSEKEVVRLMADAGIIRNQLKIRATINNAQRFLEVQKEFASPNGFSKYMWSFVNGAPIDGKIKTIKDYPEYTKEALAFSKDLKKRGFKFLGAKVVYAHMQAVGMVLDHSADCFRYQELKKG